MNPAYTECRRAVRVRPQDSEVLFDDPPSSDLMPLHDLSTDGVFLDGEPPRAVGRRVRCVLLFPQWQPMLLEGRIVRATNNGGHGFAVGFERVPQKTRRLLSDTVTTELKRVLRREQPAAMVVDGSKTVCRFVCETLGEFGASSFAEGTVLDAVNRLVRGKKRVRTVFVGNPVGSSNAFEFARFVSTQFPDVRLVLLVESASNREAPPIRRDGRVVTLLDKPWTPARLASFMLPEAWPAEV
jgi:hypothetical protein